MIPVDVDVDAAFAALIAELNRWGDAVRQRLESEGRGAAPRVDAELRDHGRLARVLCPYCQRTHTHGAASGGHRVAHCGRGGYVLVLTTTTTTEGTTTKGTPCRAMS